MKEFTTVTDSVVIECHYFKSRQERSNIPFNLLTRTPNEVWDIVTFYLVHFFQGRYVSHKVEEVFEPVKTLKGIETGTVKYVLTIQIQSLY
jgi:hypothetical protein